MVKEFSLKPRSTVIFLPQTFNNWHYSSFLRFLSSYFFGFVVLMLITAFRVTSALSYESQKVYACDDNTCKVSSRRLGLSLRNERTAQLHGPAAKALEEV